MPLVSETSSKEKTLSNTRLSLHDASSVDYACLCIMPPPLRASESLDTSLAHKRILNTPTYTRQHPRIRRIVYAAIRPRLTRSIR
jgi:hypothetical protein